MKTIGIDQSLTATGIVILEDNEIYDYFVIKSDKDNSFEERIAYIWDNLEIHLDDIDHVFIEGLSYGSNSTSARPLAGLYYYLLIKLNELGLSYESFPPTSVKKFALKGNAKKWEMFLSMSEKDQKTLKEKGHKKTTGLTDLSDAYWIAKFGNSKI